MLKEIFTPIQSYDNKIIGEKTHLKENNLIKSIDNYKVFVTNM